MEVDKQEQEILYKAIDNWQQEGKIADNLASELRRTITIKETERQVLARYFFIIALSCILLAFAAIFIDDKVLERLRVYFDLNNFVVAAAIGLLTIGWFWYVRRITGKITQLTYEIYMVLGALGTLTSLCISVKISGLV